MTARALSIYTEAPSGGDRYFLDHLGLLSGVTYGTSYSGGPTTFQCSLQVDPSFSHRALAGGRILSVPLAGGVVWGGKMNQPQRGAPMSISAVGMAGLAKSFAAVNGSSNGSALALDTVVDAARGRGLPWLRPATLGTPTTGTGVQASGSIMLDEALKAGAQALGKAWKLTATGAGWAVSMETPPTVPTLMFLATQPIFASVLDGFASAEAVLYDADVSGNTGVQVVTDAAAAARWGAAEKILDITQQGMVSSAQATAQGTADLAANTPRLRVTDPFTVLPGQLLTMGGAPVDLASVAAGVVVRMQAVVLGREAMTSQAGPLDVLIGETSYAADVDTLTLTPVGEARSDVLAALYSAMGGA